MIHLFVNYYIPNNPVRRFEIEHCFLSNRLNPFIDKIHCFITQQDYSKISSLFLLNELNDKIKYVILSSDERLTIREIFDYMNENIPEQDIAVWSNADIFYDSSIRYLNYLKENEVFLITRWGPDGNTIKNGEISFYANVHCCHDTWAWRSKIKNLDKINGLQNHLGEWVGAENRLAYEFDKVGYKVYNPCIDIVTHHMHYSKDRTTGGSEIPGGPEKYINPIKLDDIK